MGSKKRKRERTMPYFFALMILLCTCSKSGDLTNSNFEKVAEKVMIGSNSLVVCDASLMKETISLPLSELTEDFQILKLDGADAALVKETFGTIIGDKYILVKGEHEIPYKLFDKKSGNFLTNIGAYGQGPNEYQMVYDQQLDEENNKIYLLPWFGKQILVYDLKGNYLPPIPLYTEAPKGNFKVDTKGGTVIVSILPFKGSSAVVWKQTVKGDLIHSIAPGHLEVVPDFSNEINVCKSYDNYGFSILTFSELRKDTFYHYESDINNLIPVFTVNFNEEKIPIHSYFELPDYFIGNFEFPKKISPFETGTQGEKFFIVDKKTLKGGLFIMKIDFLGDIEVKWPNYRFTNNHFVINMDPGNLRDNLEKVLKENVDLSSSKKEKLTKLKNSITDNDNNYILYAKLKK